MKPKLLLHICCAPCSTHVIQKLLGIGHDPELHPQVTQIAPGAERDQEIEGQGGRNDLGFRHPIPSSLDPSIPSSLESAKSADEKGLDLVGFFYNPNIFPEEEYLRRLVAAQRLSALWHVPLDTGEYEHERFLEAVRGLEQEPEGGRRCEACYRLRLERAAEAASENGCAVVASTLTIGRNKNAAVVNLVGSEACRARGLQFLEADWKKQDGFRHSVDLSAELGLYRQSYCGCEFSQR